MTLEDLPVILYGPNESKPEEKPKIYVIHENDRWMQPLREALEEQSLEYVEWNTGLGGIVDLTRPPPLGVFYNRSSASSHTRNHRFANEYAHAILEWLELYGRRVVNGSRALQLEISKIRQYAALERCGIRTPKTVAVTGDYKNFKTEYIQNLVHIAKTEFFDKLPEGDQAFISKHNRSGRGVGVRLWKEMCYFEKYLDTEFENELPVDGITLIQQYIRSPEPYIIRCEFIDSKFVYALRASTSKGFELCPADHCSQIDNFKVMFEVLKEYNHPIIAAYERFLKEVNIEVAGIEFALDEDGNPWTYDVNTNTNYNLVAEKATFGKMTGMTEIASFLGRELRKIETLETLGLSQVSKTNFVGKIMNRLGELVCDLTESLTVWYSAQKVLSSPNLIPMGKSAEPVVA